MREEEERGAPLERADVIPDCCGEAMQPIYRYKEEGIVKRLFVCHGCGHKEEVQIEK